MVSSFNINYHLAGIPSQNLLEKGKKLDIKRGKQQWTLPISFFDLENEYFPFEDNSFDVILAQEIFEHFSKPPILFINEVNRVLKKGGSIFLTTPNALCIDNIIKIVRGENIFWPFSKYGINGRHNREYTITELQEIFTGNNMPILEYRIENFYRKPLEKGLERWIGRSIRSTIEKCLRQIKYRNNAWSIARRECIFAHCVKIGPSIGSFPASLLGAYDSIPMYS